MYKYRYRIDGRNAYYAFTSAGKLLGNSIRVVSADCDDAQLVSQLFQDLDGADHRRLQLVRATIAPAIDGPSGSHPVILQHAREAQANVIPFRPRSATADDGLTRELYIRLYQSLTGRVPAWPPTDEDMHAID